MLSRGERYVYRACFRVYTRQSEWAIFRGVSRWAIFDDSQTDTQYWVWFAPVAHILTCEDCARQNRA